MFAIAIQMAWTPESWAKSKETVQRLDKCHDLEINWSLYNEELEKVNDHL